MDEHRTQRVSEAIREELAEIIGYEMADPRLGSIDITEVLITPDMRRAQIRVHLGGGEQARQQAMTALDGARGFLRRKLAARLRLFRVPDLRFEADAFVSDSRRLEKLLRRTRRGRPQPEVSDEKEP